MNLGSTIGIDKPFNLSPKHWISVDLNGDVFEALIKDFVTKSYKIVADSISKKKNEIFINPITPNLLHQAIKID